MSDPTHVQMRFTRRWREYTVGEVAVFPIDIARSLHAQRVATGLVGMTAPPPKAAAVPETMQTQRGPAQVTRK